MSPEAKQGTTRSKEQIVQLNRVGRQWLQAFATILRTSHFHDPQNQIFNKPIAALLQANQEVLSGEGKIEFRILDDQFFLNGLWIKSTLAEKDALYALADAFKKMGLGGIDVRSESKEEHWRTLAGIFKTLHGPTGERAETINVELARAGIAGIQMHRVFHLKGDSEQGQPLPAPSFFAVSWYAKSLAALRDFTQSPRGEEQVAVLRKVQRIVCEMIDLCEKNPALFATLALIRSYESYFFHHGVNVMILSILTGREIGMERKETADLGMAALLHDIGKLSIPDEILSKPGKLTPEEWARISRHPIESAKTFLLLGYMNESVAERVLVSYEHHLASRTPKAYPTPRRSVNPTLMAEIISVAIAYDSMTNAKPYRPALYPWEAIRILAARSDQGFYRKEIVDALLRVLGPVPFGSWVFVEGGFEGIVAAAGTLAPTPMVPLVLVPGENGDFRWIDTAEPNPQTGQRPGVVPRATNLNRYQDAVKLLFHCVAADGRLGTTVAASS
ncbi:MAG: HD domain-containing phosphohydrolase [Pseudomonadota bacterium]